MSDVEQAKALFLEALELLDANDFAAAETRLRRALRIVPDRVSALTNLAVALLQQEKLDEAIEVARHSVVLSPDNVDGWLLLGSSLSKRKRLDEALVAMERAVALAPESASTRVGRGTIFAAMRRFDDAITDLAAAIRLDPNQAEARALLVSAKMRACDWTNLETETALLLDQLRNGGATFNPFMLLAMPSTAADQLTCAARFTNRNYPPMLPIYQSERYDHARIHIAYVSGDFRRHPTAQLMAGVFEHHDRARFETFGIAFGPDYRSPVRDRLERAFDRFLDVRGMSDADVANLLHRERIDIAIDLGGFTSGGRPRVFAMRPAPVQVGYLAYPGTSGSPYMDYIIADDVVIPAGQRSHYSENVVWLPRTYFANDDKRQIAREIPTRVAEGLPEAGFVFGSFNNSYKITPDIFDVWMQLLREVDGSVLWLLASNPSVPANLRREAEVRDVAPERLVFADSVAVEEHLARQRLADLLLDTPHYNAHTTACDALWANVPMISCTGDTFPSRAATSILMAMGVPELVTRSMEDYAALALRLAREPETLAAIRTKVAANRDTAPLFDTALQTRHLEAAYAAMVERHRGGQPPQAFTVPPISSA